MHSIWIAENSKNSQMLLKMPLEIGYFWDIFESLMKKIINNDTVVNPVPAIPAKVKSKTCKFLRNCNNLMSINI
jgi:hypothetical protein